MADWYVSSLAWAAISQFAASGVYSVGNIVRPLTAPAFAAQYAFRCTTAGTASTEPAWPVANNATVTTGGATFTNVSGQSTYGWSAAAGNLYCISSGGSNRPAVGDRVFLSSDHSETSAAASAYSFVGSSNYGVIQFISVNRAGSVPPVAADALSGATIIIATASNGIFDNWCGAYWQGMTINLGGTCTNLFFGSNGQKPIYLKNCAIVLSTSTTAATIQNGYFGPVTFDNTTVQFNAAGQRIQNSPSYATGMTWINTPAATLGTVPTSLFAAGSNLGLPMTVRGVDLSAVTTALYTVGALSPGRLLLDSCRIAPGVARLASGTYANATDEIELVNCYDGTSFLSERHTAAGDVTTEFTITLSGGAQDNVGAFSHKMVSSVRSDKYAMTLDSFWLDTNYATTGSAKTATVEIVSSASLNNDEIVLVLEYEGTASSSLASYVTSFPNPLTTPSAVTSSSATWNSLPATPVRQHLQVTFTPRTAGRVRAQVRLGKPSTTVYINPQVAIS